MELVIFIGLQGSGKSTFYRTYFAATHEYVSKDLLSNNRKPQRRQMQLIEQALEQQRSVVVDNTNPTPEVRKPLLEIGHLYGATVTGYFFKAEVSQSIKRNQQRTGKAKVPPVAIYATAKKLQQPTYAEGFDVLYTVQIAENGAFDVQVAEKPSGTLSIENPS
jgi:predicted kinase